MTVTDRDMGYKNLKKLLSSAGVGANIGIFNDAKTDEGDSIADYATRNEYGIGVNPRPFMRRTFDMYEKDAYDVIRIDIKKNLLKNLYNLKKSVALGASFFGDRVVDVINDAPSWATPNSPEDIRRKGKNRPLINEGIMWKAIAWKYVNINK